MKILTQKYLKVSDFLEQQLKIYKITEDKTVAFKAFARSAGSMMDLMDAERVGVLLLENDLFDLFLDAFLGQVRNGDGHRVGMIVATTFIASIKLKKLPISLQMIVNFEAQLLSNATAVIPTLIEQLKDSNFQNFEIYLLITQKLLS